MLSNLEAHLRDLAAVTATTLEARNGLWDQMHLPNLDPEGNMRQAKKPRVVIIEEEDLTCPVCLQLFAGDQVRQCINGHTLCSRCCPGAQQACPTCGAKGHYSRALLAQTLSSRLLWECGDCKKMITFLDQRQSHKWTCAKAKGVCPFERICGNRIVTMDQLDKHLQEDCHRGDRRASYTWSLQFKAKRPLTASSSHHWNFDQWAHASDHRPILFLKKVELTEQDLGMDAYLWVDPSKQQLQQQQQITCRVKLRSTTSDKNIFEFIFRCLDLPNWWSKDREGKVTRLPLMISKLHSLYKITSVEKFALEISFEFL